MSRSVLATLMVVTTLCAVAVLWGVGPQLATGVGSSHPKAAARTALPGNRPLITLQIKNGKVTGVTGTAVPASQRKRLGRAPRGLRVKCTVNFTDVRKPEGGGVVVRWSAGIGCSRSMFLSGRAYLLETARKIDGTGPHYQGTMRSASSGRPRTLVNSPNPSLYIRYLTNVHFPGAVRSGQISVVPATGQRLSKASRCVPVRTRAHGVGVQCDLYTIRSEFPPSGRIYEANGVLWMQNSLFAAGFDESRGAALTFLLTGGASVVNSWDDGREIQTAFWDGNDVWWNPTEAGDRYSHGSQILSKRITPSEAYFDTWANEWWADHKGGGPATPVPSDLHIEKWLSFVPGYTNVIREHYKVTNVGTKSHAYGRVGFPDVFTNPPFNRLAYYRGSAPFTGAPATVTPMADRPGPPYHHTTEMWEGAVNDNNLGVVVYVPGQSAYIQAYADPSNPSPNWAYNYFGTWSGATMAAGSVLQGDIYVLPGDYRAARQTIYSLHAGQATPRIFGPMGALACPSPGATISGTAVPICGWALDDVSPVSEVKVLVDNTFAGDAVLHQPRADIAWSYPDAPADSGYSFTLNAENYEPGPHTLAIVIKSADGYTTTLSTITVNIAR